MLRRLRGWLVQEVPQEVAVCMFDCPVTRCTPQCRASCELRKNGRPYEHSTLCATPVRSATVVLSPLKAGMATRRS
jgi:hypothetical protein